MISEGSCDTEVMMLKIQHCITEKNYILKYMKIVFHKITAFFCIFDQISTASMSIREKNLNDLKFWTAVYIILNLNKLY